MKESNYSKQTIKTTTWNYLFKLICNNNKLLDLKFVFDRYRIMYAKSFFLGF